LENPSVVLDREGLKFPVFETGSTTLASGVRKASLQSSRVPSS